MSSIAKLKQEIQFNKQLGGLLNALKSIAAQQFQTLERTFRTNPAFFEAIEAIAGAFDLERLSHPFTQSEGPVGVIVVTSDTGLLGGLNQQVVSVGMTEYRRSPGEMMVVGERGAAYAREAGIRCRSFGGVSERSHEALAAEVRDYALDQVLARRLGELTIVHPRALSFTLQRVEVVRVLPCSAWLQSNPALSRGIRRGLLMLESPASSVLEYLVWLWLGQRLVDVFGLSRLAELAARSVHLEGSSQELQRRSQKLWLRYFRERHEVIDQNMRELFAARSLYGKS